MLKSRKILFTGGSGRFGEIFKKNKNKKKYLFPTKKDFNIKDFKSVKNYIKRNKPKIIIHAAAISRPMSLHEKNIIESVDTNIVGTCNIVKICSEFNIKLIYFSTNYVYPGIKGNYSEKDTLKPASNYAWSKLGGECAVQMYKNSLILRICMTEKPFVHKFAYSNVITNFIFHEEIVKILPKLYRYKGIINIGGKKQSVFKFAKKYNPKVKPKKLNKKLNNLIKPNSSISIKKLNKILNV